MINHPERFASALVERAYFRTRPAMYTVRIVRVFMMSVSGLLSRTKKAAHFDVSSVPRSGGPKRQGEPGAGRPTWSESAHLREFVAPGPG